MNHQAVEWRAIPGFVGRYEVSSDGRVRTIARDVPFGCHGNGISTDNRADNLRWDTPKGNSADREEHGNTARGEKNGRAKLTAQLVREIRADAASSNKGLARKFGVSDVLIRLVKQREIWRDVV